MEKTYILGNSETVKQLGYNFIEIPNLTNDYDIHNWLLLVFQNNNIEKLLIEIGDNKKLPFEIGLHIRLSLEELREKCFIPLYFVSVSSLKNVMIEAKIWCHLLLTKGVYFSSFDNLDKIQLELSVIEGISSDRYKTDFLDMVKILPDETIGRHSLANSWGTYSMDRAAKTNALPANVDFKKRLYFKYISAFNKIKLFPIKTVGYLNLGEENIINSKGKRILLIDDEADKGWETVLRKVFRTPDNFIVINEKVKDYDRFSLESKNLIETTPFDLYLIDLRLNGTEEENTLRPNDFSGMKVLQKIKSLNQGYQVIIFTASNKVWNLKALLDAGADGYYMKESPEFGFSGEFSEQNYLRFQEDVKSCFKKDFLKDLYISYQEIIKKIDNLIFPDDFKSELKNQFQLFWDIIVAAKTKNQFANAYVTLYSVIELINNHFITKPDDGKWEISNTGKLLNWEWDKEQKKYSNANIEVTGNNPPEWQKFAGLYFQKWDQTDSDFVSKVYRLIQKRNGFVHSDKNILDKKHEQTEQYLNRDIYTKAGINKLHDAVKQIISFL